MIIQEMTERYKNIDCGVWGRRKLEGSDTTALHHGGDNEVSI